MSPGRPASAAAAAGSPDAVALALGDPAPDLPLLEPSGAEVRLGALLRGEATALIFLRHLG